MGFLSLNPKVRLLTLSWAQTGHCRAAQTGACSCRTHRVKEQRVRWPSVGGSFLSPPIGRAPPLCGDRSRQRLSGAPSQWRKSRETGGGGLTPESSVPGRTRLHGKARLPRVRTAPSPAPRSTGVSALQGWWLLLCVQ